MLAKHFVSSKKMRGGFDKNELEKSRIDETPVFKKTKFNYSVVRKPEKNSLIVSKNVKGGPFGNF